MTSKVGHNAELPDEGMKPMIVGHILIREKDTGKVLLDQRDNLIEQPSLKGVK